MLYVFFFFFKQKTAYEVRISDWSSDVCSSDLLAMVDVRDDRKIANMRTGRGHAAPLAGVCRAVSKRVAGGRSPAAAGAAAPFYSKLVQLVARKSDVSGKSVSVRVDRGGRRIIKKKTLYYFYLHSFLQHT